MRKLELAFVIVLVAVATAWWSQPQKTPQLPLSTGTPLPSVTRSGRFEILIPRYSLAGVPIGSDESAVTAALGKPNSESDKDKETHSWIYERDGQTLTVTFLENLVIAVGGSGRWQFQEVGKTSTTLFMQPQSKIVESLGTPARTDQNALVYASHPGELTVRLNTSGTVEQVWLTGEVKPIAQK